MHVAVCTITNLADHHDIRTAIARAPISTDT